MRTFFAGVDELLEAAAFRFLGGMIDAARGREGESNDRTRQVRLNVLVERCSVKNKVCLCEKTGQSEQRFVYEVQSELSRRATTLLYRG